MRLEYLPAAQLMEHPNNWRLHPAEQMDAIDTLIGEVGWAGALLYNEQTGHLLDGHARRKLFAERGGKVPVLIGSWDLNTEQKILLTFDSVGLAAEMATTERNKLLDDLGASPAVKKVEAGMKGTPVTVPIESLNAHPENYKDHPAEQIAHLKKSIQEHGFYRNIVVARDNTILAGHGVWQAAKDLWKRGDRPDLKRVPVVRLPLDPMEPKALKLVAADNEIGRLGIVDHVAMSDLLRKVLDEGEGLEGTGFSEEQLAQLIFTVRPRSEVSTMDMAHEWAHAGMPRHAPVDADVPRLTIYFESREDRATFMLSHTDIAISARGYTMNVWSARWTRPVGDGKPSTSTAVSSDVIRAHISGLPPKQQEAIRLVDLDGKTVEEAAKLLGTTVAIVQGRVQRAWSTLRKRGVAPGVYTRAPVNSLRIDGPERLAKARKFTVPSRKVAP